MLNAAASWQVQRYGASLIKNRQAHFNFGQIDLLFLNFLWNKTGIISLSCTCPFLYSYS